MGSATQVPGPEGPERPDAAGCRPGQEISPCDVKSLGFSPSPHHNCSGDCRGERFTELEAAELESARGPTAAALKTLTTTRELFDVTRFQQDRALHRWRQSLCNCKDARLRHRLQAPSQGIPKPLH